MKIEDLEASLYKAVVVVGEGKLRITYRNGEWLLIPMGADMYECWTIKSHDLTELVDFVYNGNFKVMK